ncbi:MAG: YggS family pyridoxal phosphate-dependent enzyme [Actinobacteria bacterium]|nr:YggS family pyridoxal phosphate-dependent enzyme [Actinomycetota bacterium]
MSVTTYSSPNLEALTERVSAIRARILNAGGKNVKLIAVTKTFDATAMTSAFTTGCEAVGENYAQELIAKFEQVPKDQRLPVHFIGRLQSNKIRSLVNCVDVWQSVDRLSLVVEIAKRCLTVKLIKPVQIMLQVNSTNEPDKGGCEPSDVETLYTKAVSLGLDVIGLMTVGPTQSDTAATRNAFRLVGKIAKDLGLKELSMGMTADLEIAVEEGSTAVRIGSGLFGAR